ncbi:MAG: UDP-N-acetylmuramoyl-L-alanyl-D-glutamate--2,6-diaminopimelate ligase [Patescibacteria group bacterium]|nr:UDP-N-acetylmuramoyl-L-alanyl-D-glutamate--2,6-diaminopimelate ligase [Patescibacteria group bacterium]
MWQKIKNFFHLLAGLLANAAFRYPSRHLTVIGVTGTDGKTTTVSLIYHILRIAGKKAAMVSSVGAFIKDKKYDVGFHVTTPSSFSMQKLLRKIADSSSNYAVVEVTSHALDQNRVFGIKFDVGVLTNVTHEHLDYHKTYEKYLAIKVKLLQMSQIVVLNRDDKSYSIISKIKNQNSKLKFKTQNFITYGLSKNADINSKNFPFKTSLIGEFNQYNVLAAAAVCRQLGINKEDIIKAIVSFTPPLGREDIVYDKNFSIMIDFAHTPNAFSRLLVSLRPLVKGRIIHVFGAAGERDFSKRPKMGKVSFFHSDVIVLTAEDPRSESVGEIMDAIENGMDKSKYDKKKVLRISDRQEAINQAIAMARDGDLVLLTGKGHEKSMNYGKGEKAWDEYEAVRKGLKIRLEKGNEK